MKKKARPGICQFCGCTDDAACWPPCCWANRANTVCSTASCVKKAKQAKLKLLSYFK
jgi:hypothetical protein